MDSRPSRRRLAALLSLTLVGAAGQTAVVLSGDTGAFALLGLVLLLLMAAFLAWQLVESHRSPT